MYVLKRCTLLGFWASLKNFVADRLTWLISPLRFNTIEIIAAQFCRCGFRNKLSMFHRTGKRESSIKTPTKFTKDCSLRLNFCPIAEVKFVLQLLIGVFFSSYETGFCVNTLFIGYLTVILNISWWFGRYLMVGETGRLGSPSAVSICLCIFGGHRDISSFQFYTNKKRKENNNWKVFFTSSSFGLN